MGTPTPWWRAGVAPAQAAEVMWLSLVVVLSSGYWFALLVLAFKTRRLVPTMRTLPVLQPVRWPVVSMVIPARDEEAHVASALQSRLADGYPALEVVFVDDRSTDGTFAAAQALASHQHRLEVTRVESLPEGWLGKLNALQRGLEQSTGEWVLFTDADVHWQPGTIERVVAWAEHAHLDHVTILPSVEPTGWLTTLTLEAFFRFVVTVPRLYAVADGASKASAGVGAFNLVRRAALEASGGLAPLRMEIADDMQLGVQLKRAGAAQRIVVAQEAMSLEFYASFASMTRALEKNGATAPTALMMLGVVLMLVLELGWLGWWFVDVRAGVVAWCVLATFGISLAHWLRNPRWPACLPGVGALPLMCLLGRSALLAWWRGGVMWRGTFYPTSTLRRSR